MRYQLIGVNHKRARLEVCVSAWRSPNRACPDCCRDLTAHPGIEEGMIISTCNRVEVITHTSNGSADLRGFLHDHFHLTADELDTTHLYESVVRKMPCGTFFVSLPAWIRWWSERRKFLVR